MTYEELRKACQDRQAALTNECHEALKQYNMGLITADELARKLIFSGHEMLENLQTLAGMAIH